jgi:hypothetical protein
MFIYYIYNTRKMLVTIYIARSSSTDTNFYYVTYL